MKSEITLCMIAPTQAEVEPFLERYRAYFDDFIITEAPDCQDFAKARQEGLAKVKTPYAFWVDTDDEIINPESIKGLIQLMDRQELDAIFLPYEYGFNDKKELIALHWRERLIRVSHPFKWKGVVHETLISDEQPKMMQDGSVIIRHTYKTEEQIRLSANRNHKIMEKAVTAGDEDPRLLYYLGRSYFMLEKYAEAAKTLLIYTEQSGWDEQIYDAWMKIGQALTMMDEHDKAINAILEAVKLKPEFPDAYLLLGDYYLHLNQPKQALEWLKIGISKPKPETLEITDPTLFTYRPMVSMAKAYFLQGRVNLAKKCIDKAAEFDPKTKLFESPYKAITAAYKEQLYIRQAKVLGELVKKKGNLKSYIDGLPPFIKNDLRLRPLRVEAHPPIRWPEKSIVFYCGEAWEEWGPDTLDKGMGGSEEAIVYLSRELTKQGWQVTVYNQRVEDYFDLLGNETAYGQSGVAYKPWETFNPEDQFDVFVAWRQPWMIQQLNIKARLNCADFHDYHDNVPQKTQSFIDLGFFKSEYQAEASGFPKEKQFIIPNGVVPEQFMNKTERNLKKVMYISSPDRGLDILVRQIWPKVKEAVPDAELSWAYGWESYDAIQKGNAEQGKWKWQLKRDMYKQGITELGRLSHEELAKQLQSTGVWAYPTSFPEILCISALKAQAAGVQPITSGYAALQEVLVEKEPQIKDIHLNPDEIEKYTQRLINALNNPLPEKQREQTATKILDKYAWSKVATGWNEALSENNPDS